MTMLCAVVGARPNFVKMAPVIVEAQRRGLPVMTVHTGQHYDRKMSDIFFEELKMPAPDISLGVGSGTHAEQTARIMVAFEKLCMEYKFRLVLLAGDVNSTLACALTAAKLGIPIAHVESGLRSFDRTMPEEINRIVTDHLCDLLFTTEPSGNANLLNEGIAPDKIHFVGNTMIDTLKLNLDHALVREPWKQYGCVPYNYGLVTLHRPSNVDDRRHAAVLADALREIGQHFPVIFPIHPRTLSRGGDTWSNLGNVQIVEPLGYLDFLGLMARAQVVITDSGGIQEETTALGIPCVTIRENTERPITLTQGTNRLVTRQQAAIVDAVLNAREQVTAQTPDLWDGRAAVRLIDVVERWWVNDSNV